MSIREEVAAAGDPRVGRCKACLWIEAFSGTQLAEWIDVMADKSFTHAAVFRVMRNHGYTGGREIVVRHRQERHDERS